jgi:hypothetical protein
VRLSAYVGQLIMQSGWNGIPFNMHLSVRWLRGYYGVIEDQSKADCNIYGGRPGASAVGQLWDNYEVCSISRTCNWPLKLMLRGEYPEASHALYLRHMRPEMGPAWEEWKLKLANAESKPYCTRSYIGYIRYVI